MGCILWLDIGYLGCMSYHLGESSNGSNLSLYWSLTIYVRICMTFDIKIGTWEITVSK